MAKLYFYYSAMNAGKSTTLLQAAYNYQERGMRPMLLTPQLNTRDGIGTIASRIGLKAEACAFSQADSLLEIIRQSHRARPVSCVFVDEAQFLTRRQVFELGEIADEEGIPVLAYGLRTDFQGNLFEGSQFLLAWADVIKVGGNESYVSVCRQHFKKGLAVSSSPALPFQDLEVE